MQAGARQAVYPLIGGLIILRNFFGDPALYEPSCIRTAICKSGHALDSRRTQLSFLALAQIEIPFRRGAKFCEREIPRR
jgi:hypothetical protein